MYKNKSLQKIQQYKSTFLDHKTPTKKQIDPEQYISVDYEDDQSNSKSTIYIMPKKLAFKNNKIFHPQDWSIKRFQIGRPLGKGKFGHVYLARQKKHKFIVALKVLSKKQIVNSDIVSQIRRQIQIHTHLDHPNVLKMYGFFWDQKKIYYIMQYAPGGQLYSHLKKQRRFPESKVARYIKQVGQGLIYIHKNKVFHRDIKPENILVCKNDELKISDFGWSAKSLTSQRTTMCGTLDYIGPEIIQSKPYKESVDVWALGVLAYQLATGNAPFYNKEKKVQYTNIRNIKIAFPEYLSDGLKDFILSLLKKQPKDRISLEQAMQHSWIKQNLR